MNRLWGKYRTRRKLGRHVTLWYHPRYEVPSLNKMAQSLGVVALRGKRALAQLAKAGLVKAGDMKPFPLVSLSDLSLFHSGPYLERVGHRDTLARIFGILEEEARVDEILGAVRWAVSGTVAATRSALAGPSHLAINLGGGFHHAEPEMGSGFCVFNDIGVAIRKIRKEGFKKNIVIVDLDFHQGNGNIVGFLDDPTVFSYSLHGVEWTQVENPGNFNRNLEGKVGDPLYLKTLFETLPDFLAKKAPGLVFFIAGHDVLEKDPLGDLSLSLEGARQRDRKVLELLQKNKIPTVVTLGGGYSALSCQATLNLVLAALGFDDELPVEENVERSPAFLKIAASIDPWNPQFQEAAIQGFSEEDVLQNLDRVTAMDGFPGQQSAYEIEREMEKCGTLEKFRKLGFEDFRVSMDQRDTQPRIRLEARPIGKLSSPLLPLLEANCREDL